MMRKILSSALIVLMLGGCASAYGEIMFQGVVDYAKSAMSRGISSILIKIAGYITGNPDLNDWPTLTAIHDSFTWISGFFMIALTFQGIRYIMAADSPGGRANSKAAVKRMFVGMAIVALNGTVFALGLDISKGLTDAFVKDAIEGTSTANLLLITSDLGLAFLTLPLALLGAIGLLLVLMLKNILILMLWALFPLILAMYFSQLGFLERLGGRGFNLFLAAMLSNPVMAVIFKISLDMFNAVADPSTASINVLDKFLAFLMSIAGFALAGLSPLIMLGLLEKIGTVMTIGGTIIGAAAGGAAAATLGGMAGNLTTSAANGTKDAAGDIAGQNQPNMKNDIKDGAQKAEEALRAAAVKVAAGSNFGATEKGRLQYMSDVYNQLKEDGVIKEDAEGHIQVGDTGKEINRKKGGDLMRGYGEYTGPFGGGFADEKSRKIAAERGLMSDGKLVMKNAILGTQGYDGQDYKIAVNDGGDGLFNVVVNGPKSNKVLTVEKCGNLQSREDVIQTMQGISATTGQSPYKALKDMYDGKAADRSTGGGEPNG